MKPIVRLRNRNFALQTLLAQRNSAKLEQFSHGEPRKLAFLPRKIMVLQLHIFRCTPSSRIDEFACMKNTSSDILTIHVTASLTLFISYDPQTSHTRFTPK
jgi:hypothetical protein